MALVFTIGRGNDLQCAAIDLLATYAVGREVSDLATQWEILQIFGSRFTDALARARKRFNTYGGRSGNKCCLGSCLQSKWKATLEASFRFISARIVDLVDFRYISDAITPSEH
ncbi:L-fuconate dehydratase [Candidatus Planktophila sp.]|nr:L-fuconate dehydratase [Candidatus Planktophila sp.]